MKLLILGGLLAAASLSAQTWEQGIKEAASAHRKGHLKKAEELLLQTLLQAEQFGEDDPRLAYTLDYLGTLNLQEHEPAKAEPMVLRSLKIFEKTKGAASEEALESAGRLGESYDQRQFWAKSEPLYRRIVDSGRGDAMQQSVDLNNLAVSLDAQSKQDEALKLYAQALELREKQLGPESAELPELLNNEARVYYMKGDFGAAEKLYGRSVAIDSKLKSPLLADDYERMAPVLHKQGREAEALALEAQAAKLTQAAGKKKGKQP
jgi:tetratricopeptide (TPR) repeat protein